MRYSLRSMWTDQRGIVLVLALILMGLLSALAAAYSTMIRADTALRGAAGRERQGFYAAEAGLNFSMAAVRDDFNNYTPPAAYSHSIDVDSGAHTRTVTYDVAPVAGHDPGSPTVIPAGQPFAGLYTIPSDFTVTSTSENSEGDTEAILGAQFTINSVPIFQFLAFYKNTLEILPGATMNLTGRIHTNKDLYLNGLLTIGDAPSNPFVHISAAKDVYRGRLNTTVCDGTVTVDMLQDKVAPPGDLDPRVLDCSGGQSAKVPAATIAAYLGSLLSRVDALQVPPVSTIQRGSGNLFWDHADLHIVLNLMAARLTASICPGGGVYPNPGLFPIEVQNADGSRNTAKTNLLWQFMCQRRGAIFYNDVPVDTTFPNTAANYTPAFVNASRIYRRVGEDTNGDGVIDTKDRNDDICPVGLGTAPWWKPNSCSWPNLIPVATSWFQDTDYRRGGFYNNRERRWVRMLNVNMRALIDWNESPLNGSPLFLPNDTSDKGLVIFLSVQAADSTFTPPPSAVYRYGVRIFDSADLNYTGGTFTWPVSANADPTGLTVVSDQAIYIEGNYNYKDKYPAAVIGDTINVLSQGWEVPVGGLNNDRKSAATLASGNRSIPAGDSPCGAGGCGSFSTATALGINAAFIANVDNTTPGGGDAGYNGGLENYPRFHESWSGRTLNYRGSFVSLGAPQYTGPQPNWCGTGNTCNIYNPPARNWNYEVAFNDVKWLPPLTPMVNMIQQRVYTRFYK